MSLKSGETIKFTIEGDDVRTEKYNSNGELVETEIIKGGVTREGDVTRIEFVRENPQDEDFRKKG